MYIAHIRESDNIVQTVKEHIDGVMELCEKYGDKIGVPHTAKLIGMLHDLGKCKSEFSNYIEYSYNNPEDKSLRGTVNHSAAGAKYIYEHFSSSKNVVDRLTAQIVSLVICSHHGGLIDSIDISGFDVFIQKINPKKEIFFDESISGYDRECYNMKEIDSEFDLAKIEIGNLVSKIKAKKLSTNFALHLLTKYLFSCLIDGDREDTYRFMQQKALNEETDIKSLWTEFSKKLEDNLAARENTTRIDFLRDEASQTCKKFASNESGIYRLCVPTGGGKTLSSLRYALEHAKQKEKEHIFYIIPFITILDQNAKEIKDILKRDEIILEHHSNIIIDNEDEDYKLLTEQYSSPIILTTMVQFLNTFFGGGTQNIRRMHSFTKSVIIFDEIQSLPIKCINMFNATINFLSAVCDSTIILCSATQPLLDKAPVALQLTAKSDIIPNIEQKFTEFKRVKINPKIIVGGYTPEALKNFTLEKMKSVSSTLIIMNTKKAAKQVFCELEKANSSLPQNEKYTIFHLSTNMCPAHRIKVLDELIKILGHQRVICVSTQLIEAGINISFECVIRTLAGLDSIAQAAGRCNRHGENGENVLGNLYIVNLKDEPLSMLPDIKIAKECCERVLNEFMKDEQSFGGDLLSPKAMNKYYEYYFYNRQAEMDYNIRKLDTTIYKLLSINDRATESYTDRFGKAPEILLKQAYKTAGENFDVIDSHTVGIVAPYDKDGDHIISILNGDCSTEKLKLYLKKAQRYSVNLSVNKETELDELIDEGVLFRLKNGGIITLNKKYYSDQFGFYLEDRFTRFLDY